MATNGFRALTAAAPCIALIVMSALGFDTSLVCFAAVPAVGISIIAVVIATNTWSRRTALSLLLTCIALIGLVMLTHWPLRFAFVLSKSRFDQIADRLERRETVAPQWAGTFYIRKAELNHRGMPVLWIDLSGGGKTGFGRPSDNVASDKFNEWSDYTLWGNWHHISED